MSNKAKNIILVTAFVAVVFLGYFFAIKNTISVRKQYLQLESENHMIKYVPQRLSELNENLSYYNSLLNENHLGNSSLQFNLLKTINSFALENNIKVIDFKEPHRYIDAQVQQQTSIITLEGGFSELLQCIHLLEKRGKFGVITHINFQKKKNLRAGNDHLQVQIMTLNLN